MLTLTLWKVINMKEKKMRQADGTTLVIGAGLLGSLEVYSKQIQTQHSTSINMVTGYFWKDAYNPYGFGPFPSIHQSLEHYIIATNQRKLAPPAAVKPVGEVIYVDFVKKCRIKDFIG